MLRFYSFIQLSCFGCQISCRIVDQKAQKSATPFSIYKPDIFKDWFEVHLSGLSRWMRVKTCNNNNMCCYSCSLIMNDIILSYVSQKSTTKIGSRSKIMQILICCSKCCPRLIEFLNICCSFSLALKQLKNEARNWQQFKHFNLSHSFSFCRYKRCCK